MECLGMTNLGLFCCYRKPWCVLGGTDVFRSSSCHRADVALGGLAGLRKEQHDQEMFDLQFQDSLESKELGSHTIYYVYIYISEQLLSSAEYHI